MDWVYGTILLAFFGMAAGSIFFGWLGDRLERRFPDRGRITMIQIGLTLAFPSLVGYLSFTKEDIIWLISFAFLSGLSNCVFSEGALWPVAQAILPPELRGSSRAIISVIVGAASAGMVSLSGVVVDQMRISRALLWFVQVPLLLSSIASIPLFRTYPGDRVALRNLLM